MKVIIPAYNQAIKLYGFLVWQGTPTCVLPPALYRVNSASWDLTNWVKRAWLLSHQYLVMITKRVGEMVTMQVKQWKAVLSNQPLFSFLYPHCLVCHILSFSHYLPLIHRWYLLKPIFDSSIGTLLYFIRKKNLALGRHYGSFQRHPWHPSSHGALVCKGYSMPPLPWQYSCRHSIICLSPKVLQEASPYTSTSTSTPGGITLHLGLWKYSWRYHIVCWAP